MTVPDVHVCVRCGRSDRLDPLQAVLDLSTVEVAGPPLGGLIGSFDLHASRQQARALAAQWRLPRRPSRVLPGRRAARSAWDEAAARALAAHFCARDEVVVADDGSGSRPPREHLAWAFAHLS